MKHGQLRSLLAILPAALAIVLLCSCEYYSATRAKEDTLRQDLKTLRDQIDNYTMDKEKAPQTLQDLVEAGYLRSIPKDPFTGRDDTWVPQWSNDPKQPGIVNIHSGSRSNKPPRETIFRLVSWKERTHPGVPGRH